MYSAQTGEFTVTVEVIYLEGQSEPDLSRFVWAYRVNVRNGGEAPARLVSRHWDIVDGDGRRETVDGPGVVGQTPLIGPGTAFEYHSGCPLPTPHGTMSGHYTMETEDGRRFDIEVPAFSLDRPDVPQTVN